MYPHIFVDNITTGATTVRCDCGNACASKKFEINPKIERGEKLFYYEKENEASLYENDSTAIGTWSQQVSNPYPVHAHVEENEASLYENDSTAIGTWSQQVSNPYPIHAHAKPVSLFDHPNPLPPPPYTPRRIRRPSSPDIEDQSYSRELNEQKSGLECLIEAIDLQDFTGIEDLTIDAANVSMETISTISQEDERDGDLTHIRYETGFENLLMLAEEAVKRIGIGRL